MNWRVEFGGIVNKCIWNGDESDDANEVKRMKFAHDNTEVWDRAEEMISAFTMKALPSSANNMAAQIHSFVWRVLCRQGVQMCLA